MSLPLFCLGLEVAAYLADKANSVSVIGDGTQKVPFHPVFGLRIGAAIQKVGAILALFVSIA